MKTNRSVRALVALCSSALLIGAAACNTTPVAEAPGTTAAKNDLPKIEFEKYTLPNGLDVILSEDHRLPMVAVNLWYHVGPANEEAGRTGFAHLFEHMMFQASKHVPPDSYFRMIEGAGGSNANGTTDFDRTNYFETMPSNELELALWLESDRMGYLLDVLDQASFANQQDVVRNERRQSIENEPYGIVEEAMFHTLFPKSHPYYADVIGSHADIQAAKLEDVKNFFKTYYAPNNASLAIVGDIDKAAVKALVDKYFGPFKKGPDVPKPSAETPKITAERRAVVKDRIELPKVYMAWITPPYFTPGDADADLAATILGGGKSSRLYKSLVYDKQIAQAVTAQQNSLKLGSVFTIEATARPGHTADEIEKALDDELAKFRDAGPEPNEIERARNVIETEIVRGLENLGGFGGVADRLNTYNQYVNDPGYLPKDIQRYRDATPASVKAFAQQQLAQNARVVVVGIPGQPDLGPTVPPSPKQKVAAGTGAESINADEAWRNDRPKAGAEHVLQVPVPKSFVLANGLTVLVNERPNLPIVSERLVVKTGSGANPVEKPGLANYTAEMLDEGAGNRSAPQIADRVAQLGGLLQTSSSMDASQAAAGSLKRTFPDMLALLGDVVRHPTFPQEEVERQRTSRLASLVQQREDPNRVASAVMYSALYGLASSYGYTEIGTEASNKAMTRDDLQKFWTQNFVPNNAALIVSGQITVDELKPMVEKVFGDWAKGTPTPAVPGAPTPAKAKVILVDKAGAPQTQLRVASVGVPRNTPDYEPIVVMNEILGGLFSSRINLNLREEHGYTYGASSQFAFRRAAGPFVVGTGVRTDVTGPAVSEVMKELKRMRDSDVSADELTLSKDSLVRSMPADFETSGSQNATTANTFVYDLGFDYYAKLAPRISAVTVEQVRGVAQKYIVPEKLVVIAVGDKAKVAPALARLNLGATETWNADATAGSQAKTTSVR